MPEPDRKKKIIIYSHILGFGLAFIAGWVDVLALFLFNGENASFMTGRLAKLARSCLAGSKEPILPLIAVLFSFVLGAFLASLISRKKGLAFGLFLTSFCLLITPAFFALGLKKASLILLPLALGGQNAAASLTPVDRTSHITGPLTDIGIHLAQSDWIKVRFWLIRLLALFLGLGLGFLSLEKTAANRAGCRQLIWPALALLVLGLIQEFIFKIPLIDEKESQ